MKGGKPKLQVIEGHKAPQSVPQAPDWFSPAAVAEWDRAAPELHERRLLGTDCLATLESYCVAIGTIRECEDQMRRDGRVIGDYPDLKTHPAARIQKAAMSEARLLAAELGLTPHRRGKKGDEDAKDQKDGWGDILA